MATDPIYAMYDDQGYPVYADPATATHTFQPGAGYVPLAGASGATTDPFAAPAPMSAPANGFSPSNPEAMAQQIRALLMSQIVPQRQQALFSALGPLMQLFNASPQAVLGQTAGQTQQAVSQAQQQKKQVSRRLGPMGGGQAGRANQGIQANLARMLAQLFGGVPIGARNQLLDIAQGTSQFLPPARTQDSRSQTQETPFDPISAALGIQGLAHFGQGLYNAFAPVSTPFAPSVSASAPSFGVDPIPAMSFG